MNDVTGTAAADTKPAFWYGLPHGYEELDLHPSTEGLDEVARQINALPDELRDRADQVFRLYAIVILMLQKQQVQGCALGLHPDGNGGFALSVLTVSTVAMPGVNPKLVLTKLLTDTPRGQDGGFQAVELPAATGFVAEWTRKTMAPGVPPDGRKGPREGTVWQGMVAIPDARTSSVITLQLVTAARELADDYRGVLLGVARTVTFDDPVAPAPPTSAAGAIRSPFG